MEQSLIVRGAPQEYECREGAWNGLEDHLQRRNLKRVLILHGKNSWQAAKPFFPEFENIYSKFMAYGGRCTDKEIAKAAVYAKEERMSGIVAVGGGTVSDLGKAAAYQLGIPIIILPTLAATCAAYTPLSVVYKEDGEMDRYDVYPVSNSLILIEPSVILHSPVNLMVAGIGDTLAKWYEADTMISQLTVQPIEIGVASFAARQCREILLRDSEQAIAAMKTGKLNQSFLNVIETNILLGGMVGGFGDDYGRTAGAHSIHDALTLLPDSHHQLHGNKVAYGVFVQLVIEDKWNEIEELLSFYRSMNLPASLKELGFSLSDAEYKAVAERAAAPHETIHYMKETITPEVVYQAMQALEVFMAEKNSA
ncbi:iron-containing alcohol dehydrogenase family protein [Enterococcus sp. BWB1-3]|uniref:iron-containing alcohol dehydrogenase family protein n=1 Tax=unclassified Enterococcus TaxID=2608891 RepID=UPI0019248760|nr:MULTISPECIES: iron-containing alcohol dehydrogenase family protein [unclassified Enterococcus]MBL1227743.1 iron-containing alcohol dehydrogenase family protein [Enterococcus sp. BWB1-3]MCB5952070.1 iron-containing alcohol dehydrogenase family protein [Enterococcus sp. BWT-B8]